MRKGSRRSKWQIVGVNDFDGSYNEAFVSLIIRSSNDGFAKSSTWRKRRVEPAISPTPTFTLHLLPHVSDAKPYQIARRSCIFLGIMTLRPAHLDIPIQMLLHQNLETKPDRQSTVMRVDEAGIDNDRMKDPCGVQVVLKRVTDQGCLRGEKFEEEISCFRW